VQSRFLDRPRRCAVAGEVAARMVRGCRAAVKRFVSRGGGLGDEAAVTALCLSTPLVFKFSVMPVRTVPARQPRSARLVGLRESAPGLLVCRRPDEFSANPWAGAASVLRDQRVRSIRNDHGDRSDHCFVRGRRTSHGAKPRSPNPGDQCCIQSAKTRAQGCNPAQELARWTRTGRSQMGETWTPNPATIAKKPPPPPQVQRRGSHAFRRAQPSAVVLRLAGPRYRNHPLRCPTVIPKASHECAREAVPRPRASPPL